MQEILSRFTVDSIIVEKRKTHPSLQDHFKFYQKIFEILLDYILERNRNYFSQIIILTDTIPVKREKSEIQKAIKSYTSGWAAKSGSRYAIHHYASKSDLNLQIVDYFNWAIFRKWERKDERSYKLIANAVVSEFEVFQSGTTYFY